jgi:hypothetical protein
MLNRKLQKIKFGAYATDAGVINTMVSSRVFLRDSLEQDPTKLYGRLVALGMECGNEQVYLADLDDALNRSP